MDELILLKGEMKDMFNCINLWASNISTINIKLLKRIPNLKVDIYESKLYNTTDIMLGK